jgi:hypothetical protein
VQDDLVIALGSDVVADQSDLLRAVLVQADLEPAAAHFSSPAPCVHPGGRGQCAAQAASSAGR